MADRATKIIIVNNSTGLGYDILDAATTSMRVNVIAGSISTTAPVPDATSTYAATGSDSTALEASRVVKATPGVLYTLTGYSSKVTAQFIQIHNSATLPGDGGAPVITFPVPAGGVFSYSPGEKWGKFFSAGIVVCNSTTAATKTLGSADCWFNVQYS